MNQHFVENAFYQVYISKINIKWKKDQSRLVIGPCIIMIRDAGRLWNTTSPTDGKVVGPQLSVNTF